MEVYYSDGADAGYLQVLDRTSGVVYKPLNINAALTTINTNSGGLNIIGDTNITGTGTFYSTSEGKVVIDGDGTSGEQVG